MVCLVERNPIPGTALVELLHSGNPLRTIDCLTLQDVLRQQIPDVPDRIIAGLAFATSFTSAVQRDRGRRRKSPLFS